MTMEKIPEKEKDAKPKKATKERKELPTTKVNHGSVNNGKLVNSAVESCIHSSHWHDTPRPGAALNGIGIRTETHFATGNAAPCWTGFGVNTNDLGHTPGHTFEPAK